LPVLRFSPPAEADLIEIAAYTFRTWGERQVGKYLNALEDACWRLAANPMLGRSCDEISIGLRRMEQGSHVIFYRQVSGGISVSRILHRNMLPIGHHFEDEPHREIKGRL
jgi:toxin ParE1/3/4